MALFKKERISGLYGSSAFYLSLWLGQFLYQICYPLVLTSMTFYWFGIGDGSWENYFKYIVTGFLLNQVGSNFGYMWGSLVTTENNATVSALIYMMISALGAGQFVNIGNSGFAVKLFAKISPVRYGVERMFRRIVSKNAYELPLVNFFGFTLGD
jgi:hypothetical protein